MTKEIIKLALTILGLDDILEYLTKESDEPNLEMETKISKLIVFLNYVLRQVTKEYFPLNSEEKILSSEQGTIPFSSFSKTPIRIKDVKNELDLSVKYKLEIDCLAALRPNSVYTVFYNYALDPLESINDELTLPLGLDYATLSYGVASEYAITNLMYDEANMLSTKFLNMLETNKSRLGERRMKSRRLK